MTTIVSLFDALAWPVTVLVIALFFRTELRRALDRLSDFEGLGVRASFDRGLLEAEQYTIHLPAVESLSDDGEEPHLLSSLGVEIASASPRDTIVESWLLIETEIRALAERVGMHESHRRIPYKLMKDLVRRGIIKENTMGAYATLRSLRNEAVHSPGFEFTDQDGERFSEMAVELISYLKGLG